MSSKYTAIKLKSFSHWLWFETDIVLEKQGEFACENGWGAHGARTSIRVDSDEIVGRIQSDELQY